LEGVLEGGIMSKIRIMDELLSNQIAAGEVVERCVSVVKELVENSVDANASEIKIELKEAGLREIKVIDNGIGMDKEDALLAFSRHATSKLYSADDLFSISSLGFRGEALPSIASVSEVILKTCQKEVGTLIHIKGGKIIENTLSDARIGTSITVFNLFYNTPARFKHLASLYSELANIVEYINKMALSYPNIKFVLINDNKELLNTDGSGNLLKVIKAIYGVDITKKMLEINGENEDYKISGYISLPEVNRASRNHMTTLVNGRVIKNAILNKVINEAYSSFKEDSRYPIVVINIECDPSLLDVNIHPSKADIKFSNFNDLQELVKTTITNVIKSKLLIPKIELNEKEREKVVYENLNLNLERELVKEETTPYIDLEYKNNLEKLVNFEDFDNDIEEEYVEEIKEEKKLPELYPIGLALGTYIICQNETGIYMIDQHAAQERINYEKTSYMLSHPSDNTIKPLVPIVIELPMNEFIVVKENIDFIKSLNIELEEFGSTSYRVISHPTWFIENKEEEIVKKIIELISIKEDKFDIAKFNDNLAATMACKMSVKANTNITIEAQESLINDLRCCKNPFNCPHGRPTIIHFTTYEIEKMFKRVV